RTRCTRSRRATRARSSPSSRPRAATASTSSPTLGSCAKPHATCSTVAGVTEAPVDALRRRARTGLLESAERAPARAHFRAMGVDKPSVVVYNGPMRAGRWRERTVTIQDVWEAVGAEERGLMSRADLDELERFACPGAGTCAGHFTANTMAVAIDCLGIACAGDALVPADEHELKGEAAARAGALAVHLVTQGVTARRFLDRRALLNAMAGIAATRRPTN